MAGQNVLGCACADALELIFEERLIRDVRDGRPAAQESANGVIRLGESLAGCRIGEHVGHLRQVDGVRQIARKPADVGEIENDAARQFALDAEVDVVALAQLRKRIDLERERFRQIVWSYRNSSRTHLW